MSPKSLPVTAGRPDPGIVPDLTAFDVILVSTSAGKDSQAMMDYVCKLARAAGVLDRVVAVHADLGERVEWEGSAARRPMHAYDLGMPRLSCKFCICAPREALLIAAKHSPRALDEYCAVEEETGFNFTTDVSLREIREAVRNGEADNIETVAGWGDM